MFVAFLDESGDHNLKTIDSTYPIFTLAACIFDFDYYFEGVEKELDTIKVKHFGTRKVILRSYDIRKQKGQFRSLVDITKRTAFYEELDKFIENLEFKIIAAVIDKSKLKSSYRTPSDPYNLCFQFIMERLCMFVGRKNEKVVMRMESRESHNDKVLAEKSQNIGGHQIADLAAYPIGIHIFQPKRDNPAFQIVEKKFHTRLGTRQYINYGLKIFP